MKKKRKAPPAKVGPQRGQPSAIVGIGASAGGLEACTAFLKGLPAECGFGVIMVVHLDPDHHSLMAELLDKESRLPVIQAHDGCLVEADHVYVVPPGVRLSLRKGAICLSPFGAEERRKPIDLFLSSLAADLEHRAIGIILSGNGSDGTFGLRSIKEKGGLTLVQDPDSAAYDGMPRSALASAPVDRCLSLPEMPGFVLDYVARLDEFESRPPEKHLEKQRQKICLLLKRELSHDFSKYKKSTMLRRIHRRMMVVGTETFEDYAQFLNETPEEAQNLLRELLISVTRFFRDPEAFEALVPILRDLIERKDGEKVRLWVPACASGEEAYSLAMLLVEEFERAGKPVSAQIFATDIDHDALKRARSGRYSEAVAGDLSAERLRRFFLYRGDRYEVSKKLRDLCLFSQHNLTSDPPFSHIDLISCRNLLIYLDYELQSRVLSLFHYALNEGGTLFLGTAETLGDNGKLFRTVNKPQRIFEAQPCTKRAQALPYTPATYAPPHPIVPHSGQAGRGLDSASHLSRFVLPWLDITVLVLDDQDRIKDSCGHPDRYLTIRPGPVDDSLFSLVRREWLSLVRVALHQSRREGKEVLVVDKATTAQGTSRRLEIRVCPYQLVGGGPAEGWLMVFQELGNLDVGPSVVSSLDASSETQLVNQLETELETTRHRLRATTEELESYNEELRSTNEELLSMNEELQSSNEELESSREEIQSVNQELYSVNSELHTSIAERDLAHSDLMHLFSSNPNPTIFLDRLLCIRQFTPSSVDVFHLLPSDKGRPLIDIRSRLSEWDMLARCHQVCNTLETYEALLLRQEPDSPDRSYQLRILPYLNLDNTVDGVVLSFVEVTDLQHAKSETERREHQLAAVAGLGALVSGARSLDWLYRHAIKKVCGVLSVEVACLLRCQPEREACEVVCARGAQAADHSRLMALPAVIETLRTGRTVTFSDLDEARSRSHQKRDICSGVTTRLAEDKEFPWVLGAFSRTSRRFTFDEVDFLESVAYLLGTALVRAQEHFLNGLERVVAKTLASSLTFVGAVPEMLESLSQVLDAPICELWLREPGNPDNCIPVLTFSRSDGRTGPGDSGITDGVVLPDGESLMRSVWEKRIPIWIAQHKPGDPHPQAGRFEVSKTETMSGFALPLLSGEERLGVLVCFFARRLFCSERLLAGLSAAGRALGELIRRNRAELTLRQSEKNLFHALKAVPFPLCIVGEGGELLLVSSITHALTGFPPSAIPDVVGWSQKVFRSPAGAAAVMELLNETIHHSQVYHHGTFGVWSATGQRSFWEVTTAPLTQSPEGARTMLAVAHDVSERERERHDLEKVARNKDGFLALLGHELRNPLAAIRGGVQLMGMATSSTELDEVLSMVDRQSAHMVVLIEGLLDLNRIALGKLSLDPLPLDLRQLALSVLDDKRALASSKGLSLVFEPGSKPAWALGDRMRLTQVLDNLIGNCLKFTDPPGLVTVSVQLDASRVGLRVKDSGKGMTPELAAVVFEPFRQGEPTSTGAGGGLGLGLALVKQILDLHGGTVEVKSDGPGQGCEFSVWLPECDPLEETPASGARELSIVPLDIVYVEDDIDLALSLSRLLEKDGHQVRHALDAKAALELVRNQAPAVILSDIGLAGEMDGFALLEEFQKVETLKEVPVVAVTGFGMNSDKERSRAAGFSAHLTKPVELEEVRRLLANLAGPSRRKPPHPDFFRILVVDDNAVLAQATTRMLQKAGFETSFACSVGDALNCFVQAPPHLALLDLGLPGKSGIELKEEFMQLPGGQTSLYVALTGSEEAVDFQRTREAGFVAHLVKPVSFQRLIDEIERVAEVAATTRSC